jgi:hypothetical protein
MEQSVSQDKSIKNGLTYQTINTPGRHMITSVFTNPAPDMAVSLEVG